VRDQFSISQLTDIRDCEIFGTSRNNGLFGVSESISQLGKKPNSAKPMKGGEN
jgi:hypothetical protein